MQEQNNLTESDVKLISKMFPIEPLFNKVVITLNKMVNEESLNLSDSILSEEQYIVAKGPMVTSVTENQKVIIDLEKLMVPVRSESVNSYEVVKQIKVDPILHEGITYAIIEDRYIKAKYKI